MDNILNIDEIDAGHFTENHIADNHFTENHHITDNTTDNHTCYRQSFFIILLYNFYIIMIRIIYKSKYEDVHLLL